MNDDNDKNNDNNDNNDNDGSNIVFCETSNEVRKALKHGKTFEIDPLLTELNLACLLSHTLFSLV